MVLEVPDWRLVPVGSLDKQALVHRNIAEILVIAKYAVRPKPAAVKLMPDSSEICNLDMAEGRRDYYHRIREMAARQNQRCAICLKFMADPTFDHERTRRLGQDDRITHPDGTWRNAAVCYWCNIQKGSRRYHWLKGKYVPVEANCS